MRSPADYHLAVGSMGAMIGIGIALTVDWIDRSKELITGKVSNLCWPRQKE
jgi:hypothetical protein